MFWYAVLIAGALLLAASPAARLLLEYGALRARVAWDGLLGGGGKASNKGGAPCRVMRAPEVPLVGLSPPLLSMPVAKTDKQKDA